MNERGQLQASFDYECGKCCCKRRGLSAKPSARSVVQPLLFLLHFHGSLSKELKSTVRVDILTRDMSGAQEEQRDLNIALLRLGFAEAAEHLEAEYHRQLVQCSMESKTKCKDLREELQVGRAKFEALLYEYARSLRVERRWEHQARRLREQLRTIRQSTRCGDETLWKLRVLAGPTAGSFALRRRRSDCSAVDARSSGLRPGGLSSVRASGENQMPRMEGESHSVLSGVFGATDDAKHGQLGSRIPAPNTPRSLYAGTQLAEASSSFRHIWSSAVPGAGALASPTNGAGEAFSRASDPHWPAAPKAGMQAVAGRALHGGPHDAANRDGCLCIGASRRVRTSSCSDKDGSKCKMSAQSAAEQRGGSCSGQVARPTCGNSQAVNVPSKTPGAVIPATSPRDKVLHSRCCKPQRPASAAALRRSIHQLSVDDAMQSRGRPAGPIGAGGWRPLSASSRGERHLELVSKAPGERILLPPGGRVIAHEGSAVFYRAEST